MKLWQIVFAAIIIASAIILPSLLTPKDVKAVVGTATFQGNVATISGQIAAGSFADAQNIAYWLDPASTGTSLAVAGNVGIGTVSPATKLDVSSGIISVQNSAIALGSGSGYNCAGCGSNSTLTMYDAANGAMVFNTGYSSSYYAFQHAGSEQVRISSAGNVGIGTTTPGNKLDVKGSIDSNDAAGSGNIQLANSDGTGSALAVCPTSGCWSVSNSGGDTVLRPANAKKLVLSYGNSASNFPVAIGIDSTGNVGIGTTSPGQKLTVAGTVESTSGGFKFPDGTTQTTAGTSRWGGAYTFYCDGATCASANPQTGGCSCPAGFSAYQLASYYMGGGPGCPGNSVPRICQK